MLKQLNYDVRRQYIFSLDASLSSPIQQRAVATVVVNVLEENDHVPSFPQQVYRVTVSEDTLVGTPVITVPANDLDTIPDLTYEILSGANGKFVIDSKGEIIVNGGLNYDLQNLYNLFLQASDNLRTATTRVEVTIIPINKPGPQFTEAIYVRTVPENYPTVVPNNLIATVAHINGMAPFAYTINEQSGRNFFTLDQNGNIRAIRQFNYEAQKQHTFTITVQGKRQSGRATVVVNIQNIDDVCPVILGNPGVISYLGNPPIGALIHVVRASDADNLPFNFTIASGNDDKYFSIDRLTGQIRTVKEFPKSFSRTFFLQIGAKDGGCPLPPTQVVNIKIDTCADPQDFHFKRPRYVFYLKENRPLGYFGTVSLTSNRQAQLQILTAGITSSFSLNNGGNCHLILFINTEIIYIYIVHYVVITRKS